MGDDRPDRGLLGRLGGGVADAMLALGSPVTYAPGDVVFREGDADGHVVLLLRGAVKVRAIDQAGDPALLAVKSAGDLVGEMSALDGKPRSATVIACGEVGARLIRQFEFRMFLVDHVEVLVELFRDAADQVRWANRLRQAVPRHAEPRIALVLVHLVQRHGRSAPGGGWGLDLPLTNVELASIAGMKPRTAEKAFGGLRDAGVLVTGTRRVVHVPDLDRLKRIAAGHR
ncbi:Crp/Fnr family transcriptional regulator [Actinosynnema sp. NPDC059797]